MNKKILKELWNKSKWMIFVSIMILYYLYNEVTEPVFIYFCFIQIWLISVTVRHNLQNDLNAEVTEFTITATEKIKALYSRFDEIKKAFDDIVNHFGD